MSITLTAAVSAGDSNFSVSAGPVFTSRPFLAQIEAEQVLVEFATSTVFGQVHRGQNGTAATAHASSTVITPLFEIATPTAPGTTPVSAAQAVVTAEVTFTETTGAGTYTGTVVVPAGATILEVIWRNTAVWTASTSASMTCGDDDTATGFFTATNTKTTPTADSSGAGGLSSLGSGGTQGAYGGLSKYCAAQKTVTATVVTVGASGSAGRSRLLVRYALPSSSAASKA